MGIPVLARGIKFGGLVVEAWTVKLSSASINTTHSFKSPGMAWLIHATRLHNYIIWRREFKLESGILAAHGPNLTGKSHHLLGNLCRLGWTHCQIKLRRYFWIPRLKPNRQIQWRPLTLDCTCVGATTVIVQACGMHKQGHTWTPERVCYTDSDEFVACMETKCGSKLGFFLYQLISVLEDDLI